MGLDGQQMGRGGGVEAGNRGKVSKVHRESAIWPIFSLRIYLSCSAFKFFDYQSLFHCADSHWSPTSPSIFPGGLVPYF